MPWSSARQLDELLAEVRALRTEVGELRARVEKIEGADELRTRLDEKQKEVERLSAQGLHVMQLLHEARATISDLEHRPSS